MVVDHILELTFHIGNRYSRAPKEVPCVVRPSCRSILDPDGKLLAVTGSQTKP